MSGYPPPHGRRNGNISTVISLGFAAFGDRRTPGCDLFHRQDTLIRVLQASSGPSYLASSAAVNVEGFAAMGIMWSFIGLVQPALLTVYATLISLLYCDVRVQRGERQPTSTTSG